jgi:hypothetical protein
MPNDHGKADGAALSAPNYHFLKARQQSRSIPKHPIPSILSTIEKETKMKVTNNSNEEKKTVRFSATMKSPFKKTLFAAIDKILQKNDDAKADDKDESNKEQGKEWIEVGNKNNKKSKDNDTKDKEPEATTKVVKPADIYRIGINIRMLSKKAKPNAPKPQIDTKTMAIAMLSALHSVHDQAWYGPIQHNDGETDGIHTIEEIRKEETDITKHFEDPKTTIRGHFFARFYLHSNIPLEFYKRDTTFMKWLETERIKLEVNNLSTTTPVYAGFFTEAKPRHDLTDLFQARLRENTPTTIPPYQLTTTTLYAGGAKTRVYIAETAEENVDMVRTLFTSVDLMHNSISFYPWNEYTALNKERKLTIINAQNEFVTNFSSLVLSGFTGSNPKMQLDLEAMVTAPEEAEESKEEGPEEEDKADEDTEMQGDETTDKDESGKLQEKKDVGKVEEDPLLEIGDLTMTAYLTTQIKAGDGASLFEFVYAPVMGKIEFLIQPFRYQEALSFLKMAHRELAREMSLDSVRQALTEPEDAILAASQSSTTWVPFKLAGRIAETATATKQKRNPKRQNTNHNNKQQPMSYSAATSASGTGPNPWNPYKAPPQATNVNTKVSQQTTGAIEHLQKQLDDLRNVTGQIQSDNRTIVASIENVKTANQQNTAALQESVKLDNRTIVESIENVKTANQQSNAALQESVNNQYESAINQMRTVNVESEKRLSNQMSQMEHNNRAYQVDNKAMMDMLADMRKDGQIARQEQSDRHNEVSAKVDKLSASENDRCERDNLREKMDMLISSRIADQPEGDVTRTSPSKTPRQTLDMSGASTGGQIAKKSKTNPQPASAKLGFQWVDNPMEEDPKSCSQSEGYAAKQS